MVTHDDSGRFLLTESGFLASQIASPAPGECPYTMLIGAGASLSSGIPDVSAMIREWRQEVFCHLHGYPVPMPTKRQAEYETWESGEYRQWLTDVRQHVNASTEYGTLFQYTRKTREERQMYIERLVADRLPSPGYLYLAGLIHAARVNRVLTPNFDDLLTDAMLLYYRTKPLACAYDSPISGLNGSSQRAKLVKLHGDFLFDTLEMAEQEMDILGENMQQKIVEMCEDKGLVVVGYSGNDESIMGPIRDGLRKNPKFLTKGIHWCLHRPDASSGARHVGEEGVPEPLRTIRKRHPDRVFLYAIPSFDRFMESVFYRCGLALPDTIRKPYENSVANLFYKSCQDLELREPLSAQMRDHMDKALEGMADSPDGNGMLMQRARTNFGTASDLHLIDEEYADAAEHYQTAFELAAQVLAGDGASKALRLRAMALQIDAQRGLGQCRHAQDKTFVEQIHAAYEVADAADAIKLGELTADEAEAQAELQHSFLRTLGFEAELSGGVSKSMVERARRCLDKVRATSVAARKLAELAADEALAPIADVIDVEVPPKTGAVGPSFAMKRTGEPRRIATESI
ncbi:MAG: SIR2 family protein [Burkholderiaceae bacterium]